MVELTSQFYQSLLSISKFFVWCWKISRINSIQTQIAATGIRKISNYNLADRAFDKPNTIVLLFGQSDYTYTVKSRKVKGGTTLLTDTISNWTVSGFADTDHTVTTRRHSPRHGINLLDSQSTTFNRFLETQDFSSTLESQHSSNELEFNRLFDQFTMFGPDRGVMVRLPINKSQIYDEDEINNEWLTDIGHSVRKAFRRFFSNEREPRQNREAIDQYKHVFQEMIDTCHIEKVPVSVQFLPLGMYFIMLHHMLVWKSESRVSTDQF